MLITKLNSGEVSQQSASSQPLERASSTNEAEGRIKETIAASTHGLSYSDMATIAFNELCRSMMEHSLTPIKQVVKQLVRPEIFGTASNTTSSSNIDITTRCTPLQSSTRDSTHINDPQAEFWRTPARFTETLLLGRELGRGAQGIVYEGIAQLSYGDKKNKSCC